MPTGGHLAAGADPNRGGSVTHCSAFGQRGAGIGARWPFEMKPPAGACTRAIVATGGHAGMGRKGSSPG